MTRRIIEIDSLRAFAAGCVLLAHWLPSRIYDLPLGRIGVNLFFVISGFLITSILLEWKHRIESGTATARTALADFYTRRSLRIFPAYYVFLAVAVLVGAVQFGTDLLWQVFYLTNVLFASTASYAEQTSHLWTLAAEEQFYLFWPALILTIPKRWLLPAVVIVIACGPASRLALWFLSGKQVTVAVSPMSCLDSLGGGALLAILIGRLRPSWLWLALAVGGLALALALIGGPKAEAHVWNAVFFSLTTACTSFGLIGLIVQNNNAPNLAFLRIPPVVYIGRISYGIYLYHDLITFILPFRGKISYPIWIVAVIAVATASWFLIERPSQNFARYPRRSS